jgi:hypothetical protein
MQRWHLSVLVTHLPSSYGLFFMYVDGVIVNWILRTREQKTVQSCQLSQYGI